MNICILNINNIQENQIEELSKQLHPIRREKIEKKKLITDKKLSLGAGLAIRKLAEKMQLDYSSLDFVVSESGKEFISGENMPAFNISHSGEWVVAVMDKDSKQVGVDVQQIREHSPKVVDRCFTDREKEFMAISTDADIAFAKIWSRKESFVKCLGTGITFGLDNVETVERTDMVIGVDADGKEIQYYCKDLDVIDGYSICVCSSEQIVDIECI